MHMTTADFAAAHLEFLARCGRVTHVVSALAGRLSLSLQAEVAEIVGQSVPLGDGRLAIAVGQDIPSELSVLPVRVSPIDLAAFEVSDVAGTDAGDLVLAQLTAIKHRLTQMDRLHDRMDGLEHALADRIAVAQDPLDAPEQSDITSASASDQRPALDVNAVSAVQSPAPSIDPDRMDMASRETEMLEAVAALLQEKRIVAAPVEDSPTS